MTIMSVTPSTASIPTAPARAADGDYKTAGTGHMTKDSDSDYKAGISVSAAPASAVATSSSAVQSALINLQKRG